MGAPYDLKLKWVASRLGISAFQGPQDKWLFLKNNFAGVFNVLAPSGSVFFLFLLQLLGSTELGGLAYALWCFWV